MIIRGITVYKGPLSWSITYPWTTYSQWTLSETGVRIMFTKAIKRVKENKG